jgi:hypothetical protein
VQYEVYAIAIKEDKYKIVCKFKTFILWVCEKNARAVKDFSDFIKKELPFFFIFVFILRKFEKGL